ncbi:MAG: bifunctional metallophosphatase/5'-nucleotidase [Anaerolineae bacterium]|nr:bifunctional metallophosphatase/5'-nucleotidase [Gloeobacterales cyanobacterium ES-bin-313]
MIRLFFRNALLALSTSVLVAQAPASAQSLTLTVLHNNDGETRLINAGGSQTQYGGVDRFASLVRNLRTAATNCSANQGAVLISAGDNFLAGSQFNASLNLPSTQSYYDTVALDLIGYTVSAIGNHEFDFAPDVTARFIGGFGVNNPSPVFVSANLDVTAEPALLTLAQQRRIANSALVRVCNRRIGIVGATTPLLPAISSPRAVVVSPDLVGKIQAEVDRLQRNGANIIILTSHLQSVSEDLALVPQLRGVDIAISGGGSDLLNTPAPNAKPLVPGDTNLASVTYTVPGNPSVTLTNPTYPIVVNGADGKPIRVITTDGNYKYVGKLIATFDSVGDITSVDTVNSGPIRVSGNPADLDVVAPATDVNTQVVVPVEAAVASLAANVIAASQVPLDSRTSNIRTRETNLGNLMADAMFFNGTNLAASFNVPVPDVSIQNSGGIRGNTLYLSTATPTTPANFTELNTFDIAAFANFVSIVPNVPRAQFKEILENTVSRFPTADGRFAQIAGLCMVFDPAGTAQVTQNDGTVTTPGTRVREAKLANGTFVIQNGSVVAGNGINVVTNDFSARGGDQYPFRGLPFTTLGITYQQSLFTYVTDTAGLNDQITVAQYPGAADVASGTPTGTGVATRILRSGNCQ